MPNRAKRDACAKATTKIDGPLNFNFDTRIGDPLPELTDAQVRALATNITEPTWPIQTLKSGEVIEVQLSVDENGALAGVGFGKTPPEAVGPITEVTQQWTFKPLIQNGKPQYFHGTVRFVDP